MDYGVATQYRKVWLGPPVPKLPPSFSGAFYRRNLGMSAFEEHREELERFLQTAEAKQKTDTITS